MEALKSIIIHILNKLANAKIFETWNAYFTYKARPQTLSYEYCEILMLNDECTSYDEILYSGLKF